MDVKELIKPPFANYDVVVYFGCGLFSLPLIHHYIIEPAGLRFPRFGLNIGIEFADIAVSTLSLLFTVYILGHMVAYAASFFIEKTVDTIFGKVSSAIIISDITPSGDYYDTVQGWIARRLALAFKDGIWQATTFRIAVLAPVLPALFIAYITKSFDYFKTRIPPRVFAQARRECRRRGYGPIGLHTKWYKAIEHDVMNNCSVAVARMYNYLVISGIFRSLSFLFLMCCWGEIIYWAYRAYTGHEIIKTLMSDNLIKFAHITTLALFNILFIFSLTAYVKFARRYAEEAIFAFVLTRTGNEKISEA